MCACVCIQCECVSAHVFARYTYLHICMHRPYVNMKSEVNSTYLSQSLSYLVFGDCFLYWSRSSSIWQDWMANELQVVSALHIPRAGFQKCTLFLAFCVGSGCLTSGSLICEVGTFWLTLLFSSRIVIGAFLTSFLLVLKEP